MSVPVELSALTAEVTNTEGVEASAVALINGFAAAVDAANAGTNSAISAVTARMRAASDSLAAAVAANPSA